MLYATLEATLPLVTALRISPLIEDIKQLYFVLLMFCGPELPL